MPRAGVRFLQGGPQGCGAWWAGREDPLAFSVWLRLAGVEDMGLRGRGLTVPALSPAPRALPAAFAAGPACVVLTLLL